MVSLAHLWGFSRSSKQGDPEQVQVGHPTIELLDSHQLSGSPKLQMCLAIAKRSANQILKVFEGLEIFVFDLQGQICLVPAAAGEADRGPARLMFHELFWL